MYVYLSDDQPHEVDEKLNMRVQEASLNRLSQRGTKRLDQILKKHRSILRVRLGSGGAAEKTREDSSE